MDIKINKETVSRYAVSTALTFFAGFAIAVIPQLESVSLDSLSDGVIFGVVFSGVRLGIKMVLESFLYFYNKDHRG
jgi:hypothetical protein